MKWVDAQPVLEWIDRGIDCARVTVGKEWECQTTYLAVGMSDVLGWVMGMERSLLLDGVPPSCGDYFKVVLSQTAVRLLIEETRSRTTGMSFDDYPLRDVHPDWAGPGERFACRLNRVLVYERKAAN